MPVRSRRSSRWGSRTGSRPTATHIWRGPTYRTAHGRSRCIDPDAPTVPETVGRDDVQIPVEQPRAHVIHWAMADIAPDVRTIAAGSCSDGVTARGKQQPQGPAGARQGLNDYTGWFAGDAQMGGDYVGYDGPYPPFNDLRVHRYFFRLFALDVAALDVPARFTAADVERAMQGHVLAEAALHGTYTLNSSLLRA